MAKIALCLEDDPKMPISRALNMSFNGGNVYFSEGNERLASCMHTQLKKGYDLVIGLWIYHQIIYQLRRNLKML